MKIYISGCHGAGKSTVARYVSETYFLPFICEVARTILSEQELHIDSLRADINITNKYQKDVFERQIVEENKHQSFVSDRCLLDILAYSAQHTNILKNLINSSELFEYVEKLKNDNAFIFFIRPSKATLKADGVRESLSWDGVVAIDAQIKLLFEMFDIRYFQINTDNMQERIRLIDSVLSLYKK